MKTIIAATLMVAVTQASAGDLFFKEAPLPDGSVVRFIDRKCEARWDSPPEGRSIVVFETNRMMRIGCAIQHMTNKDEIAICYISDDKPKCTSIPASAVKRI